MATTKHDPRFTLPLLPVVRRALARHERTIGPVRGIQLQDLDRLNTRLTGQLAAALGRLGQS